MFRAVALLGILAAIQGAQAAGRQTGEQLVEWCGHAYPDSTNDPKGVYCLTYISGFIDSMVLVTKTNGPEAALFCLPLEGFTVGKALHAVMTYAAANPESKSVDISVLTNRALRAAFPCP